MILSAPAMRVARARPAAIEAGRGSTLVLCAICGLALALRLAELDDMVANPFYDVAVRSMATSWHNFFVGAFEPGGRLAIDKPAVDLWLQVASVKLLGFGPLALKLPEAVGGLVAVPLLYDAVRRLFGRGAGLMAAAALAVLPVSVLTARSDTTDSVMMALLVAAAWLTVRAAQRERPVLLVWAAVAVGLAFNVKLFEALVPVPALAALYFLGSAAPVRRRLVHLLAAGGALVVVGLLWVTIASLASRAGHPFPMGSSDGTMWDVVFGFNGQSRLVTPTGLHGIAAPGPVRLLAAEGRYGQVIGSELGPAIVLALLALLAARRGGTRLARAGAVGIGLWLLVGLVLFSHMGRLHPRYVEAFTPAVAAALGAGLAGIARHWRREWLHAAVTAVALAAVVGYVAYVARQHHAAAAVAAAAAALAVAALVCVAALRGRRERVARAGPWVAAALAAVACLALPAAVSLALVRAGTSDAGTIVVLRPGAVARLNAYLGAHRHGARYEMAVYNPTVVATAIIAQPRPILPLTSWRGLPLVGLTELKGRVAAGQVRYVLTDSSACAGARGRGRGGAGCLPTVRWAQRTGADVTRAAGLPRGYRLFRVSRH